MLKLVSEGARVLANDLDADALAVLQADVVSAGGTCEVFPGDVTGREFGDRAVGAWVERLGDLDILVNNAGYTWNSRIANHTDEWYAMIDVHAPGPFRLLRAAGHHFRQMTKEGRSAHTRKVVNVSSVAGLFGKATQFSYSAAKSALVGMTRSLAKDWGRYNVTVNCVALAAEGCVVRQRSRAGVAVHAPNSRATCSARIGAPITVKARCASWSARWRLASSPVSRASSARSR